MMVGQDRFVRIAAFALAAALVHVSAPTARANPPPPPPTFPQPAPCRGPCAVNKPTTSPIESAPTGLADDAAFLRRMKPSLIKARIKGEAPTNLSPAHGTVSPTASQLAERQKPPGEGPNPWLVLGVAFAAGIVVAKLIDWRGHAHPRD